MNRVCVRGRSASPTQITNGPRYRLELIGGSYKPRLHLSFMDYDFGPCHIWQQGMLPTKATLVVENRDEQPVSYDVVFDDSDVWQVSSSPSVLSPGQRSEIVLAFRPAAAEAYTALMLLRVNGLYSINVTLAGEEVLIRFRLQAAGCPLACCNA